MTASQSPTTPDPDLQRLIDQEEVPRPYFRIEQGQDGNWYPKLIGANNEQVWRGSEGDGYEEKRSAEQAIFWLIGVIQSNHYRADF
jgi:uncharacterized protein YegP (UPF0339 family)